jgi:hypothetical protein
MTSSDSSTINWEPTTADKQRIPNKLTSCPKCNNRVEVVDISEEKALNVGIHYLVMRCSQCSTYIDAAGIGLRDTYRYYSKKMEQLRMQLDAIQRFHIRERNMWSYINKVDAICITTNGFVKKDGYAVMGKGCAFQATKRYKNISKILGEYINAYGNRPFNLIKDGITQILSFPVKPIHIIANNEEEIMNNSVRHMISKFIKEKEIKEKVFIPGWACLADPNIIRQSCKNVTIMADKFSYKKIILPCPGVGAGELDYEEVVKPILIEELDDRFTVVFLPRRNYEILK